MRTALKIIDVTEANCGERLATYIELKSGQLLTEPKPHIAILLKRTNQCVYRVALFDLIETRDSNQYTMVVMAS